MTASVFNASCDYDPNSTDERPTNPEAPPRLASVVLVSLIKALGNTIFSYFERSSLLPHHLLPFLLGPTSVYAAKYH